MGDLKLDVKDLPLPFVIRFQQPVTDDELQRVSGRQRVLQI